MALQATVLFGKYSINQSLAPCSARLVLLGSHSHFVSELAKKLSLVEVNQAILAWSAELKITQAWVAGSRDYFGAISAIFELILKKSIIKFRVLTL